MIIELGHFCLILGVLLLPIYAFSKAPSQSIISISAPRGLLLSIFTLIFLSYLSITYGFLISDFSLDIVTKNSSKTLADLYKVAGVWGNHEGSLLLWLLMHIGYMLLFECRNDRTEQKVTIKSQIILSMVGVFLGLYIFFFSNPFLRSFPFPLEGNDLTPLLQDFALLYHPPILYLGYTGMVVPFALGLSILSQKKTSPLNPDSILPWVLFPLGLLTLGILAGSFWAYYELGWGGWWFWDPVENISLIPWLFAVCIVHTLRSSTVSLFKKTLLLTLPFYSILLGTLFIRSNALVSVHSFAMDKKRGLILLISILVFLLYHTILFLKKNQSVSPYKLDSPPLIENTRKLVAVFLIVMAGLIALGTFAPGLINLLFNGQFSLSSEFYEMLLPPIFFAAIGFILIPIRSNSRKKPMLAMSFALSLLMLSLIGILMPDFKKITFLILAGGIFLMLIIQLKKLFSKDSKKTLNTPMHLTHFLLLLFSFFTILDGVYKKDSLISLKMADTENVGPFHMTLQDYISVPTENYLSRAAIISLNTSANENQGTLKPERRIYYTAQSEVSEAAQFLSKSPPFSMLTILLGHFDSKEKSVFLRVYYNPYLIFIWLSGIFLSLLLIGISFKRNRSCA